MNITGNLTDPFVLSGRDVTAVLGPTNTGKTHLAIERLIAHESGIIGLPLRLLAREVYGRVCDKVGAANVALVTGEEKILPPGARYSVCTVEAMPRKTDAAFVAIDEVQIAGDLERGHIFTDRLLHLRGRQETLLLGSGTMRGILERLLPGISVVTRPRMSTLTHSGAKKITRLPRRSAIVAFSADEVYAIGELIRRQRGGAAVVLGALSPRTRNAQVALYQSGDVDYLVATDAIGMGLNLDVDHVAFAQNRKFDGFQYRQLTAAEIGQIAGRAGRHIRDGTFGVTGRVDPFDDGLVARIEAHEFEPVKVLQWRTAQFDFSSLDALKQSIATPAPIPGLTKALPAVDAQALDLLSREEPVSKLTDNRKRVSLLWDTCALPDYRRIAPAQHADIIASIYLDLARDGHVDEDYLAEQVRRADRTDGDIDTLSARVAQIRTWTFVSHRPGWLQHATHWQEKARDIEDRLSDALHERLTKRFVDRRTSVLMKRLRENSMLEAEISPEGDLTVEGHHVGTMQGFRFTADQSADGEDAKAVRAVAQKALAPEFEARATKFSAAPNGDLALGSDNIMRWLGSPVASLSSAEELLKPRVILLADEQLTGPTRDKVAARVERYVAFQIDTHLKPLLQLSGDQTLTGVSRGIAFRIVESCGIVNRRDILDDVRALDQDARAALRRNGVRFGAYHLFVPLLLKPAPAELLTQLWALKNDAMDRPGYRDVVAGLASGRTSMVTDQSYERTFYKLAGYRLLGKRAVRVDILERLADLIRPALFWKPGIGGRPDGGYDGKCFMVTPAMMSILGATAEDMEEILKSLGYRYEPVTADAAKAHIDKIDAEATAKAEADTAAKAEAATDSGSESTAQSSSETAGKIGENTPIQSAADETEASGETIAEKTTTNSDEGVSAKEADKPAGALDTGTSGIVEPAVAKDQSAVEQTSTAAEAGTETGSAEEEEPKPVLLWRQARFGGRPQHSRGKRDDKSGGGKKSDRKGKDSNRARKGHDANRNHPTAGNKPRREPKQKQIDPDSPFAKLAALKEQMKK